MPSTGSVFSRRWMMAALIGAPVLLIVWVAVPAADQGRTVYYQVTHADGSVRDVSAVPRTNKGIRRVLRITRLEQGQKGYDILSTGRQTITHVNRGQTYKTDLIWTGRAWVEPSARSGAIVVRTTQSPTTMPAAGRAELTRVRAELIALAGKLLDCHEKLTAAEESLKQREAGSAAATVAQARKDIQACLTAVTDSARRLRSPARPGRPPAEATGRVEPAAGGGRGEGGGIGEPIRQTATLPHRVQVWKLPAGEGRRTYRVSMAHAEANAAGAMHYVAYADTDGDGRPDELIARSPRAVAKEAGGWTQWQFTTDRRDVFVGATWPRCESVRYHTKKIHVDDNWRGLSGQTHVSVDAWGVPLSRWGPSYGNIRVWGGKRR